MLELLEEILYTLIYITCLLLFFRNRILINKKFFFSFIIVFLLSITIYIVYYYILDLLINTALIGIIFDIFIIFILLSSNKLYTLFSFLLCYSLSGVLEISAAWILSKIVNVPLSTIMQHSVFIIIGDSFILLFLLIILYIFYRNNIEIEMSLYNCFLLAFESTLGSLILFLLSQYHLNKKMRIALEYSIIITSLLSIGICIIIIAINTSRKHLENKSQMQKKYILLQRSYLKQIKMENRETRRLYHDIQEHINIISLLHNSGKESELQIYLENISEKLTQINSSVPKSGDDIIDAILLQKLNIAASNNIHLDYSCKVLHKLNIDPFDIVTILGNLIDNSIEYCNKNNHSSVKIKIRDYRNNLYINVSNPINKDLELEDILGNTSKTNKKEHGIGLINIKDCVENNNGQLSVFCKNGYINFQIIILMS